MEAGGRPEGVGGLAEELLDLRAADVLLALAKPVEVVPVDGQAGLFRGPGEQLVDADCKHLRLGEGHRRIDAAAQSPGALSARRGGLVGAVDRGEQRGVDRDLAERPQDILGGREPIRQRRGSLGQVVFELSKVWEPAFDPLEFGLPLLVGGEDAARVPGVLDGDVDAGRDRLLTHLRQGYGLAKTRLKRSRLQRAASG